MTDRPPSDRARLILSTALIAILMLIIAFLLMFIVAGKKKALAAAPRAPEHAAVVTMQAKASRLADIVYLPGRIEPAYAANLAAEKAGIVTALAADKGDRISKGQVLLNLDDRLWRTALAQAESSAATPPRTCRDGRTSRIPALSLPAITTASKPATTWPSFPAAMRGSISPSAN
jgi:multidrug efflux pump subunit AcrA (membrane-fusion protein)